MDAALYGLTTDDSLYYRYNSTMRARVPEDVELWADYSRIIDSALHKLPPQEAVVYRGFHVSLTQASHEFQPGKVVWLVSITSTTTDEKHTLKFFGSGSSSSPGTLMKIHALSAKDIKAFSVVPAESELVFSLNTCLSIERVITSQELMSLKGLIDDLPENVDLIVAREQCATKDTVTAALAKDAADLKLFESQHYSFSKSGFSSSCRPSSSLPAGSAPSFSSVPQHPPPSFHDPPSGPPPPAKSSRFLPSSTAATFGTIPALKAALCNTAASAIAYYDDLEFASHLCNEIAIEHDLNEAVSVALQEASITLQNIIASKPPSLPSKAALASALADAHTQLSCEIEQLQSDISRAKKECEVIPKKLQEDEAVARSLAADDMILIEYQHGVDAALIRQLKDDEARALASLNSRSAQDINARAKAYIAECSQRVNTAKSARVMALEQQLLELRTVARDASAAGEERIASARSSLEAASHDHLNQLIVQARKVLYRQPDWPQIEPLLRFDLPLQRLTTHFIFSHQWFTRFFCLRGRRLYYSDGKNGFPDTREGTLEYVGSNPDPDGRYCVELNGAQ
jgi:hypothetical protein